MRKYLKNNHFVYASFKTKVKQNIAQFINCKNKQLRRLNLFETLWAKMSLRTIKRQQDCVKYEFVCP